MFTWKESVRRSFIRSLIYVFPPLGLIGTWLYVATAQREPNNSEQEHKQAWNEGVEAAEAGVSRQSCPYPMTDPRSIPWRCGWDAQHNTPGKQK